MIRSSSVCRFLLVAWLCLPGLVVLTGCEGCSNPLVRKKTPEELRKEEEGKKEKPKEDFEPIKMTVLPGTIPLDEEPTIDIEEEGGELAPEDDPSADNMFRRVAAKPGHWVHARYKLKANNFDFKGEIVVQCVNQRLEAMPLEQSPYWVTTTRPAALPKGQSKEVEVPLFVSVPPSRNKRTVQIMGRLRTRGGGRDVIQDAVPVMRLKPYQYHMVVLARSPDRYGYLRTLDTIKPPFEEWKMDGFEEDFIVTMHGGETGELLPLPNNPLAWTTISCLVWDNLPPDDLDPDQQTALLDWLHWGGLMIVSGPNSLDTLRGTFLDPYLPAKSGKTIEVPEKSLTDLNRKWSIVPNKLTLPREAYLLGGNGNPIEMVELEPIEPAGFVEGTGDLVVERNVGRGRIIATAFSLTNRRVVDWQNFDGFVNGCLMRRPRREFSSRRDYTQVSFVDFPSMVQDARINSELRYFTRDAAIGGEGRRRIRRSLDTDARERDVEIRQQANDKDRRRQVEAMAQLAEASGEKLARLWGMAPSKNKRPGLETREGMSGFRSDQISGMAGWSDFTPVGVAARASLKQASGISVPDSKFVAKVLSVYLLCLVPLNWVIFRVVRRVELAWFAAPLIAIAGAVGVVRMAQLDIGFVRSRTEIAIVELQPEYTRAHVTRFTGLYTSLTSRYSALFEDSRAFALPFSTDPSIDQLKLQTQQAVSYVRDKSVGLSGYPVLSNSTGMVHVEQMLPVAGQVELSQSPELGDELTNKSQWQLKSAVAVHKLESGEIEIAVVGDLPVGEQKSLDWRRISQADAVEAMFSMLADDPTTRPVPPDGEVTLRDIYRHAMHPDQMRRGDIRLVGWTDESVEGMELKPESNQNTYRTLVLSHLKYGPAFTPQVDVNHIADHRVEKQEIEPLEID